MNLPLDKAAALLLGAGAAGALTMLGMTVLDLTGGTAPAARLGALGFAFLLTVPLVLAATAAMRPGSGASRQARSLATLGILLWLGGVGADLFVPQQAPALLTVWHSLALVGALAFVAAALALRPRSRAERRRAGEVR